jgi:hypothetical protein
MRVTTSRWEMVWLGKEMLGTVEQMGHPETRRWGTAKVRWDNGHRDQWWEISTLYPVAPVLTLAPPEP